MRLPMLVLCSEVEGTRVLEVGRQDDRLVAGLAWKLNSEIPGIQGHKRKFQVVACQVLLCELVKPVDGFAEGAGMLDVLPG